MQHRHAVLIEAVQYLGTGWVSHKGTETQTEAVQYLGTGWVSHKGTETHTEAVQYLGTGWVNADSIVKVCLGGMKLQSNCPALCHLTSIRSQHMQTYHTLLSDHTQSTHGLVN